MVDQILSEETATAWFIDDYGQRLSSDEAKFAIALVQDWKALRERVAVLEAGLRDAADAVAYAHVVRPEPEHAMCAFCNFVRAARALLGGASAAAPEPEGDWIEEQINQTLHGIRCESHGLDAEQCTRVATMRIEEQAACDEHVGQVVRCTYVKGRPIQAVHLSVTYKKKLGSGTAGGLSGEVPAALPGEER